MAFVGLGALPHDSHAAWRAATGALTTVSTEERLYRLDKLCPPTAVAGEPRSADDADTGVLVDWLNRFHAEQFGDATDPAAARSVHAAKQLGDEFVLWTLESDLASMAAVRSPAAGVSRIGPVHTPPTGADTATARR